MQPLDPIRAEEAGRLAQEAELLRYEVRHLRARLAAAEASGQTAKGAKKQKPAAVAESATAQRDRQAYDDLVWLLGRLDSSPAGPVLRRVSGFGTLRDRYLGGGSQ